MGLQGAFCILRIILVADLQVAGNSLAQFLRHFDLLDDHEVNDDYDDYYSSESSSASS